MKDYSKKHAERILAKNFCDKTLIKKCGPIVAPVIYKDGPVHILRKIRKSVRQNHPCNETGLSLKLPRTSRHFAFLKTSEKNLSHDLV